MLFLITKKYHSLQALKQANLEKFIAGDKDTGEYGL
jgi:hypothetical protein